MEQWLLNAGPGGIVIVGVILLLREVRRFQPDILGKLEGINTKIVELKADVEVVSLRLDEHIAESREHTDGRKSNSGSISLR